MNRRLYITGTLVLLLALSTGCGQKPGTAPADNSAGVNVESGTNGNGTVSAAGNVKPDSTEQDITNTIETYYTDEQMLDLTKATVVIKYPEEQEKYKTALQTLKSSDNTDLFALWGKVEFKSAELESGLLTIDISLPEEARLGAGGEVLALDALKQTMFQFDEVKSIELLVDGKQTDTLMGHEELEHPMTRN